MLSVNKITKSPSTFLIPYKYMRKIKFIELRFGNLRNYLKFILKNDHSIKNCFAQCRKTKILYQDKDLMLIRKNFRPFDSDWEKLRIYANGFRISMSLLFVMLLGMDSSEGVPTKSPQIILKQSLTQTHLHIYIKFRHIIL